MSTGTCLAICAVMLPLLCLTGCGTGVKEITLPKDTPALHKAVARDDVAAVQKIVGGKIGLRGPYSWTPLHVAALANAVEAAKVLLTHKARVNVVDRSGMSPLHWAARKGNLEMVRLLLSHGAEVMARNKFDMIPLHEATTVEVTKLLLDSGSDIHARDIDFMTPLHTAPNKAVADLLIERGANIHQAARDGRTPMDMPPLVKPRKE